VLVDLGDPLLQQVPPKGIGRVIPVACPAEKFAALDLNWWTCIPEEVIGPDLQEMRNIHLRLKPTPWIASDWGRGDR